jgi:trigger factor
MLALEAVAAKENITASDEDVEKRVNEATGKEGEEAKKIIDEMHPVRRKEIERSIRCEKALDFVMEKAVATDDEEFETVVLDEE